MIEIDIEIVIKVPEDMEEGLREILKVLEIPHRYIYIRAKEKGILLAKKVMEIMLNRNIKEICSYYKHFDCKICLTTSRCPMCSINIHIYTCLEEIGGGRYELEIKFSK